MSDSEPPPPTPPKRETGRLWAFWLGACAALPAVAGALVGHQDELAMIGMWVAGLAALITSIGLARGLGKANKLHPGVVVLLALVFLAGGCALGIASMLAGCLALGKFSLH